MSRLRDRNGNADDRSHFVICGADSLVYTLADELAKSRDRVRLTVIVPPDLRADVPDFGDLIAAGVEVIEAERLDERTFREAGLAGAEALALVMPDDRVNLHAALCARAVEADLRLVIRLFTGGLSGAVRSLFSDCRVLSDAAMAAPAFVAASLGEVAPTLFRYAGRTLYVARRGEVAADSVILSLAGDDGALLPADGPAHPTDLVLAEGTGRPAAETVTAHQAARSARRRRAVQIATRSLRLGLTGRLAIATDVLLLVMALAGGKLADYGHGRGLWSVFYTTLLSSFGGSDMDPETTFGNQLAQVVLILGGVVLVPLITAAVVDGLVRIRLELDRDDVTGVYSGHIVLVGLGNVGTRVLRQLHDLGLDVVAIDKSPEARGAAVAQQLGVPFVVGDAAREETLRRASVATCRALIVVSTDDLVNLQAALYARNVRPDLRVVLRLFDDDFARRAQTAFNIDISRSVSRLCAPVFAAAVLEREVLATIPVDRHALLVATVLVLPGSELDGVPLAEADRPGSVRVIAMAAAGAEWVDWNPDERRVLNAGDRVVVVARRDGLRKLQELVTETDPEATTA